MSSGRGRLPAAGALRLAAVSALLFLLVPDRAPAQGHGMRPNTAEPPSAPATNPAEARPKVSSVGFIGNTVFGSARLGELLLTQPWRPWAPSRYYPEVLQQDRETLRLFYEQQGYLEARIVDTKVTKNQADNSVDIQVELSEGPLTRISEITITGNQALSREEMLGVIKSRTGAPFQSEVVRDDLLALIRLYAERGYLDADVNPDIRIDSERHQAAIRFSIDEKLPYRVGRIILKGYEKTRPHVIQREIDLQPGQIVRYSSLLAIQRRLFRTGLFQSIFVTPVPPASVEPGVKDIQVEVKENKSIEINASVGYSTLGKLGADAELKGTNIAGLGLRAGLSGDVDFQKWGVGAALTEPRLFDTHVQTDLNVRFEQLKQPGYDLTHTVGNFLFSRQAGERSQYSLGYQYEHADISNVTIQPAPTNLTSDLQSVVFSYVFDTRTDLMNPRQGIFLDWRSELGQDVPLPDLFTTRLNPYLSLTGSARGYVPLTPTTVLASAVTAGWITHLVTDVPFPLNQHFYAGGPTSLRGYDDQSVGPKDVNGIPLGGTLMAVWNVFELRQQIYGILSGALFLDAGGVWAQPQDFDIQDVRYGLGAGVRLNTPVGVVRFDAALKIAPRQGESPGAVYLSIGQSF